MTSWRVTTFFFAKNTWRCLALCIQSALCLIGCSENSEETQLVNAARLTVGSSPPVIYRVDEWTILDKSQPNYPKLQWLKQNPTVLFQAQMPLSEGSNSTTSILFSY